MFLLWETKFLWNIFKLSPLFHPNSKNVYLFNFSHCFCSNYKFENANMIHFSSSMWSEIFNCFKQSLKLSWKNVLGFFEIVGLFLKLIYFKEVWFWTYLNHTPYDLWYLVQGHFKCTSYFPSERYTHICIPFIFLSITIATSITSIKPYRGRTKGNGGWEMDHT